MSTTPPIEYVQMIAHRQERKLHHPPLQCVARPVLTEVPTQPRTAKSTRDCPLQPAPMRSQAHVAASRQPPVLPPPAASAEVDDATLVMRCRAGDGTAWARLVERYQRLVYAIVRRAGLDEHTAADVFQTVFSRLLQHLPRIAEPHHLQAWIVTTAKRESLLLLRQGKRTVSMARSDDSGDDVSNSADWDLADDTPIAEEALDHLQQLNQLRNALERLDTRCRDLLLLMFRDEDDTLSYEEVARRMGASVGSIGPTRSRCLDKLRRLVS